MSTRVVFLFILVAVVFWAFWRSSNLEPDILHPSYKNPPKAAKIESKELPKPSQQPPTPLKTSGSEVIKPPVMTPGSSSSSETQELSEVTHLTRDEFIEHFQTQTFESWLAKAEPYAMTSSEAGLDNGVAWEHGIIVTGKGEVEYRYWVAFNEQEELKPHSCISIRRPQGDLIIGSAAENSLTVYKLSIENSRIYKIKDKHFFVTYGDGTESRQGPHGNPTNPLLLQAWLYYTKESSGRYIYQGKRERRGEHTDQKMEMNAHEFCNYSYLPRPVE